MRLLTKRKFCFAKPAKTSRLYERRVLVIVEVYDVHYELPRIQIIGGVTAQWVFNLYTPMGELFDAYNCIADCSIVPFYDKTGPSVASFACSIVEGPTKLKSAILVQLAVQDTVHLHGKYVYQITIRMPNGPPGPMDSAYGKIDIPLHGILYIGKNIKPEFINSFTP